MVRPVSAVTICTSLQKDTRFCKTENNGGKTHCEKYEMIGNGKDCDNDGGKDERK
jgi:hypothetical protein